MARNEVDNLQLEKIGQFFSIFLHTPCHPRLGGYSESKSVKDVQIKKIKTHHEYL